MPSDQKQKYQAYSAATQTVAQTKQIVLLYDGMIRFLQQAREAMVENRIEDRYNLLIKATDVISGLQACLDFEKGGNIATILYSFYASIDGRIFSIHRTGSIDTCDMVIADLKKMRDIWHEIDQAETTAPASIATTPATSAPPPTRPAEGITLSA